MNVGEDTTLGDGDVTKQLVQLLVISDGELKVTGDDTGLLVVTGGVASQLENLGSEVLKDSGQVDGGTWENDALELARSRMTNRDDTRIDLPAPTR